MFHCADCEGMCFEYVATCSDNLHRGNFNCHVVWYTCTDGTSVGT